MIMEVDSNNMRVLLLNKQPFFKFKKPSDFIEKQFFYFEALRFCHLHLTTMGITTDFLIENLKGKRVSYFLDKEELFYHPVDKKFLGKFITNKICNKIRFVNVLNFKSNFWSGS